MKLRHVLLIAMSTCLLVGASAVAAQDDTGDDSIKARLDRLEKQLHEVREIVLQARSTGKPVEIKEAGPDPEVVALSAKFDDVDQTLRSLNAQVETLTHEVELAKKDASDARAAAAALSDRLDKLEQAAASQAVLPQPAADSGQPAPDTQAAPASAADAKAAYASARRLMMDGDYAAAATAFQSYVDHFGDAGNLPEARYWLGETKYAQGDYAGAAVAYLGATKDWPQTVWGADAEVKLALSLMELNKPADACATLSEFDHHYAKANAAAKARAAAARIKAKCAA